MADGSGRPSSRESARLLRQQVELGAGELFLDGLTREEALRLARAARAAAAADTAATTPETVARPPTGPGSTSFGGRPASPAPAGPRAAVASPTPAAAPGPDGSTSLPVLPDGYDELRSMALACTRCRLAESRTQVVFSDGQPDARVMVVGEAPGANEDETGLPFVGAAGKYLDLLLATVGLSREDSVYIANVLKCRPPGNRDPLPDEIACCSPYLEKQIEIIRPEVLLAVGSFSGRLLTGQEKSALGKLRGHVHTYHGVPLVVTYHPAALLRNPRWTRAFWDDLQLLRSVLDT